MGVVGLVSSTPVSDGWEPEVGRVGSGGDLVRLIFTDGGYAAPVDGEDVEDVCVCVYKP